MKNPTTLRRLLIACILGCQFPLTAQLLPDSLSTSSLKLRTLEDLMDMDITIVSKRSERWFEAPAAVFVISRDDIRRSGARSIPEALRLAPSLNIAQVNSNQWAISTRGFTSTTANKLLVLIDGRSVYTQLYSGVFWDVQDVVLHDVDRIEVISGPGGTLWGTNAVNGIINIITKSSRETAGSPLLIEAGAGIRENFSFTARSGGTFGGSGSHRTYLKYFERDETKLEIGGDPNDGWSGLQGGFRIDRDLSPVDGLIIQGDAYRLKENQRTKTTGRMEGGNILAAWHHTVSDVSSLLLRSFFDYSHRRIPNTFSEDLGTFDIEFEHQMNIARMHELNWGLGFKNSNDRVGNSAALAFLPPNLQTQEYNAFIQDAVSLSGGMKVTVGSKFSNNDFSGFEYQPRISLGWSLNKEQFLWASVTRAVRTPSRIDRDFYVPGTPPYRLAGGSGFVSEKVLAYEAGYRTNLFEHILVDAALYYNTYDDIRSVEVHKDSTLMLKNGLEATTYGSRLAVTVHLAPWWKLKTSYMYFQKTITAKSWSNDANKGLGEGNDPKHRIFAQSMIDIGEDWEIDLWARYIDALPNANAPVPAYTAVDARFGKKITDYIVVSLLLLNITEPWHTEFGSPLTRYQIGREVFGKLSVSL